jgi:benzylsuccinate CoA-transferase BbsF subunit
MINDRQALRGVKVLDFTWVLAGPLMTKYLADYGATVARIESRERPCFTRTSGPFKDNIADPDHTGYFAYFNSNKYSMSLRLDCPQGIQVVKRLVCWADVVAESFRPGVLSKLGLNYEELRKIKPDIVMISSSGQGQTGPAAGVPIAGNWLMALGGFPTFSGWPDRAPSQPFGPYTDFIAPRFGAIAVLAALRHRQATGRGQYIDLSQLEAGIQFLTPAFLDYTANRRDPQRIGNASPYAAPHGVYPCLGNRWCAIAVENEKEWRAFCKATNNSSWTEDPRFATLMARKQSEEELNLLVGTWTVKHTPEEAMKLLQKAGVPAGVVESPSDLWEDPQLRHRDCFWMIDHRVLGKYPHLGQAAALSKTPARGMMPSPCLGEHTQYTCEQFLGMSDEEFAELFSEGAFDI